MEKLHFSITINAPVSKTWDTMLQDKTYRQWTNIFSPGSHYKGDWSQGSEILFLAPHDGQESGMVSRIKENRKHEFISIEHVGIYANEQKDLTSPEVQKWAGALENYTFKAKGDQTEVHIEVDMDSEHTEMFNDIWPKALQHLKNLAEA